MLQVIPKSPRSGPPASARCHLTASRRVSKKYRRAFLRRLKLKEYNRLKSIVPSVSTMDKVSKLTVIEEAIKYIDQLHHALADRLRSDTASPVPVTETDAEELAKKMFLEQRLQASGAAKEEIPATSDSRRDLKRALCEEDKSSVSPLTKPHCSTKRKRKS